MSEGHSLLAPSGAYRWTECTASVGFIEAHRLELDFSSSDQADEGIDAHTMANAMFEGEAIPELKYDSPEMRRIVKKFVAFVKSLLTPTSVSKYEIKVPLFYYPEDRGTVDVLIIDAANKRIYVVDLKYGAGVSVKAQRNKQLATYAESALREQGIAVGDDWIIDLIIYQPRDRSDPEAVRQWVLRRSELATFCNTEIQPAADAIMGVSKVPLVFRAEPTGWCKFCEAKAICEAFRNYGLSALPVESVDDLSRIPEPKMLTRAQRLRVIAGRQAVEAWLESVEDYEVAQLMNGVEPHGFKLVEGKSNRSWKSPEKVIQILTEYIPRDQVVLPQDPALITVVEAESLIGKKEFESLRAFISKPPGKPTLVPIGDKRPALTFGPSRDFEDLDAPAPKAGSEFV